MEEERNAPEFDFSLSTVWRISFCFENSDDNRRMQNHKERFTELQTALTNLAPFMVNVNKKTGEIEFRAEYSKVKELEKKVYTEFKNSNTKDKHGKVVFSPTDELIKSLNEFDEYLRIVAMRFKLYMKIDNDADQHPIARRARVRQF